MTKRWALLAVFLTGCTGVDGDTYMGMPGSRAWFDTASPATIADYFQQRCISYGFSPGTPEMAQCIQTEAVNSRESASRRMGAALASAAAIDAGNATRRRPVTTTCNRTGSHINCTSF